MANDSLPEDFLNYFDVQLQEFYYRVVCKETSFRSKANIHGINRALKEVVEAYKKDTVSKGDSSISFDGSWQRCAYVIKHSTCFTSAVASYLLKLINHKKIKDNLWGSLENARLNICCLGGGPATDAVAVITIARGLYHSIRLKTGKKLAVHVTVVDLSEDWHGTAKNVFHCLEDTPEFFGIDELILTYSFIKADLTQDMEAEVKNVIKTADIITLIYFLSAVNGSKAQDKSLPMMQRIMRDMKKGAFLFFLDSAADRNYKVLNEAAENRRSMKEIYGPLVEEFHTISLQSVRKFMELYAEHFKTFFCMTNIFICVSSWYKLETIQPKLVLRKYITKEPAEWETPSQEESDDLTEKMLAYRASVKKLVNTYWRRHRASDSRGVDGARHLRGPRQGQKI